MNELEHTLVVIKPLKPGDRLPKVEEFVREWLESAGFNCLYRQQMRLTQEQAVDLYEDTRGKWYHAKPIVFILSGEIIAMVWSGEDAISTVKKLVGPTSVDAALESDSIRGDLLRRYGCALPPYRDTANFVHAPGTTEEFKSQMDAVFGPEFAAKLSR